MPKRAASFYDPSPGDSERLAFEKMLCRHVGEQLRVNPYTGKPCEFGERLIDDLAGSTLSMDERHHQLHEASEIRGFLLEPAKLHPIAKLAEGTLRLHPMPLEAISVKKEVKEIRAAAIVAIQSGTLPGIDREPYSARFSDFCLWLPSEFMLRQDLWIKALYEHVSEIAKRTSKRPRKTVAKTEDAPRSKSGEAKKPHFAGLSCSQLEVSVTVSGLGVRGVGVPGRAKVYNWGEVGLRIDKSAVVTLLFEIARSEGRITAVAAQAKPTIKVAVCRFNQAFKDCAGVSDNLLSFRGRAIITTAGSIGVK